MELLKIKPETEEALGRLEQELLKKLSEKKADIPFGVKKVDKHDFGPEEERSIPAPTGELGAARLLTRHVFENDPNIKFSDLEGEGLNKKDEQEKADELIREKAKELFLNKLFTHGKLRTDAESGKTELKSQTDLDGQVCLALLKEAGIDTANINYIQQDDELPEAGLIFDADKEQGWVLKKGGKLLSVSDKDKSSGEDSTAKFIYEGLVEFRRLEKKSKVLDKIVEFATKEDNKKYDKEEITQIFENYHCNLMGLRKYLDADQLLKVFKDQMGRNSDFSPYKKIDPNYLKTLTYLDPKTGGKIEFEEARSQLMELKRYSKNAIEKMKQEGFVMKTGNDRNGDVLIDLGRVDKDGIRRGPRVNLGYFAARYAGFGGYVIYDKEGGFCSIQATEAMKSVPAEGFSVSPQYHLISKMREEGEMQTTLEEVMRNLSGKSDSELNERIGPALKKILAEGQEAYNQGIEDAKDAFEFLNDILKEKIKAIKTLLPVMQNLVDQSKADEAWRVKNISERKADVVLLIENGYKSICIGDPDFPNDSIVSDAVVDYVLNSLDLY
jgi:hypothetical protein